MLTSLLALLLFRGSSCARVKPFSPCYFETVRLFQLHWLTCWKSGLEHKSFFHDLLKTSVSFEVEAMKELSRTVARFFSQCLAVPEEIPRASHCSSSSDKHLSSRAIFCVFSSIALLLQRLTGRQCGFQPSSPCYFETVKLFLTCLIFLPNWADSIWYLIVIILTPNFHTYNGCCVKE